MVHLKIFSISSKFIIFESQSHPNFKNDLTTKHCVQPSVRSPDFLSADTSGFHLTKALLTDLLSRTNENLTNRFCMRFPIQQIVDGGTKVYKGTNPEVDSYSVFWDNKKLSDTSLCTQLKQKGISDIYVCGLAYDVCVG